MGVRRNVSSMGQSRQFVDNATQMDVHKKCPMLRQQLQCFPYEEMFVLVRMDILRLS